MVKARVNAWVAILCFLALVTSCGEDPPVSQPAPEMTVHFIDVGQGASTLVQGPDFSVLIDAGTPDGGEVVPYLRSAGIKSLDLLIGTHPHADHIGQVPKVLLAFPVKAVWLSGDPQTTRTFERALDAIQASPAVYHEPRAGETFVFGSSQVRVLSPATLTGNLNNDSIAIRLTFQNISFIFTGDAEEEAERTMTATGAEMSAQVLQLGHHGSSTASSKVFVEAVRPRIAVYSASAGNPYGFPHAETLATLAGVGVSVYGTDVNGTVRAITDGTSVRVLTARAGIPKAHPGRPVAVPAG